VLTVTEQSGTEEQVASMKTKNEAIVKQAAEKDATLELVTAESNAALAKLTAIHTATIAKLTVELVDAKMELEEAKVEKEAVYLENRRMAFVTERRLGSLEAIRKIKKTY
jgi:hypothetical protein